MDLIKSNDCVSIITQSFSDLDLKLEADSVYRSYILNEAMTYNKFVDWFLVSANSGSLDNYFENKEKLYILNTDLINRIPSKKSSEKSSKKSTKKPVISVIELISMIKYKLKVKVIFISEVKKNYKLPIRPTIIGDIIDYSNPLDICNLIMYEDNIDKVKSYLIKSNVFFDLVMPTIQNQLRRHRSDPEYNLAVKSIDLYYKMRFEAKKECVIDLLSRYIKFEKKLKVIELIPYSSKFDTKKVSPK
jgi:hypothetical protein